MTTREYFLRSLETTAADERLHDKQLELEVNNAASVSKRSAMLVTDEMALLKLKPQIAEAESAKKCLSQNQFTASLIVQQAPVGTEDRRLKYTSTPNGVLIAMPSQEALVPSWLDAEATLDSY